jgi:RNA polymerase sigma-70 factor (ECF subfamily)
MAQPSDEVLLEKSKAGDVAAFKMLVLQNEGKVAGVIRSMLGTTPEAEDVGQEVFLRFYDALDKFRGDSSVSTYLVRIAINLSLNEPKRAVAGTEYIMDLKEQLQYEFGRLDSEFQAVATFRLIKAVEGKKEDKKKLLR